MSDSSPFTVHIRNPIVSGELVFGVQSSQAGPLPWTYGHPFVRGHFLPGEITAVSGASQFQVEVRNVWDDGSVKFAVLSGVSEFLGSIVNVGLGEGGVLSSSANVVEPSAAWYLANVSVELVGDGEGTYSPSGARATGLLSWDRTQPHKVREILGPVMSEFHYFVPSSDPQLSLWFYVRAYVTGHTEVELCIENGWANLDTGAGEKFYTVTVTVGGVERFYMPIGYSNWFTIRDIPAALLESFPQEESILFEGQDVRDAYPVGKTVRFVGYLDDAYTIIDNYYAASQTIIRLDRPYPVPRPAILFRDGHPHHTRWSRVDWAGNNPDTNPRHDGLYLMRTGYSGSYYMDDGPTPESTLNNLDIPVWPFQRGDWPSIMA